VAGIVQGIESATGGYEILDRLALRLRHPGHRFGGGKIRRVFQVHLISGIGVGPGIAARPDHAVAQDQKQLIGLEQRRRQAGIVHGVIDGQVQFMKDLVQADMDVIGIVITIAD